MLLYKTLGMSNYGYRLYPVRGGEKLNDILSKRNITSEEFQKLNPNTDGATLQGRITN